MYNKRIKYNDDIDPFWINVGISVTAIALGIAISAWVNKLQDKWYIERIQSGKLREQDIVKDFVTDLYANITKKLPRDYIIMEKERLRKLRDCRTFKDLKRALRYIDLDTSDVDYLERRYKEALASRPKRIGVNGKVAYDRKPKGIVTHDSMPWSHVKPVNYSLIRHRDDNNERTKKKIQQNIKLAEQSVKELERSDDSQLRFYLDKIKKN